METDRPSVVEVITDSMRYVDTYGWFEANRIFMEEVKFKRRERARAHAGYRWARPRARIRLDRKLRSHHGIGKGRLLRP